MGAQIINICSMRRPDPDRQPRAELDALRLHNLGARIAARRGGMIPRTYQAEIADRAGISRTELSRIERGAANPSVTMIYRIADALGCHVQDLLDD